MERKILLLTAKTEIEASVKLYKDLLVSAEKTLRNIEMELIANFKNNSARYSYGELANVKRRIVAILGSRNGWVYPRILLQEIIEHDTELVMRELHKLSSNSKSKIVWNAKKGPASQYRKLN